MRQGSGRGGARDGSVIVLSLLMTVGLVVLTASLFRLASGSSRRLNGGVDERRAALIAEAGLNDAFEAIRRGGSGAIGSMASCLRQGLPARGPRTEAGRLHLQCLG